MKMCQACEEPNDDAQINCKVCLARLSHHPGIRNRSVGHFKSRLNYRLIGILSGLVLTWGISGAVLFRESMANQFAGDQSPPPRHAISQKPDPHQKYRDAALQVLAQLQVLDATRERTGRSSLNFTPVTRRTIVAFEATYRYRPEGASASYTFLMSAARKYARVLQLQTELQQRYNDTATADVGKVKEMNEVWAAADVAVLKARVALKIDQVARHAAP